MHIRLLLLFLIVLLMSGCNAGNVKDVLGNLERDCVRHYAGSAATGVPGNATITFTIDCKPLGTAAPDQPPK